MSVLCASVLRRWHVVCAAALLCAAAVHAQSVDTRGDAAGDPPDRAARLSYLDGDVGLLPAGAQDWGAAEINRPLTRGDKLSSGPDARAELELDGGTLRIDQQTRFGFLELNDNLAQVELTGGTLNLAARRLGNGQSYEIDTPTVALVVDRPGTFRVDVADDGQATTVTALDGDATVYGENGAQRLVHAGRSYEFRDSTLQDVALSDIRGADAFDAWCSDRDRRYAQPAARGYVSDDVVGYQDLDRYGDWQSNAEYGQVWYPTNVASDWAPYRDGHWSYIAPWGWTWVDDSPWGFAPYHYGRWAYIGNAWGWVPGPVYVRPIYAPALVAFVGGSHWNVSIGIGSAPVGWFPLGPGEVYNPWYHSSRNYYTQVNVTNINVHNTYNRTVIINRINNQYGDYQRGLPVRGVQYANRDAPRGFTAVPAHSFTGAQRVQRDLLHVDPRQLAAAPVLGRATTPRPTPRSLEPPGPTRTRPQAHADFQREVVARHAPPPAFAAHAVALHAGAEATAPARPVRVRLLADQGATLPAAHRIEPVPGAAAGREAPMPAFRADTSRPSPARDAQPAREAPLAARAADDMRAGELPSARFARGRRDIDTAREPGRPAAARGFPAERPGVSYVSSNRRDRQNAGEAPPVSVAEHLPPARHFERATPDQAAAASRVQPAREDAIPLPPRSERREDAAPAERFGQAGRSMQHSMRAPDFNRPPPVEQRPERVDRPPPGYQPAQGYELRRPMPQAYSPPMRSAERAAPTAEPARRAPAESGKAEHRADRRDDPQH